MLEVELPIASLAQSLSEDDLQFAAFYGEAIDIDTVVKDILADFD